MRRARPLLLGGALALCGSAAWAGIFLAESPAIIGAQVKARPGEIDVFVGKIVSRWVQPNQDLNPAMRKTFVTVLEVQAQSALDGTLTTARIWYLGGAPTYRTSIEPSDEIAKVGNEVAAIVERSSINAPYLLKGFPRLAKVVTNGKGEKIVLSPCGGSCFSGVRKMADVGREIREAAK